MNEGTSISASALRRKRCPWTAIPSGPKPVTKGNSLKLCATSKERFPREHHRPPSFCCIGAPTARRRRNFRRDRGCGGRVWVLGQYGFRFGCRGRQQLQLGQFQLTQRGQQRRGLLLQ